MNNSKQLKDIIDTLINNHKATLESLERLKSAGATITHSDGYDLDDMIAREQAAIASLSKTVRNM